MPGGIRRGAKETGAKGTGGLPFAPVIDVFAFGVEADDVTHSVQGVAEPFAFFGVYAAIKGFVVVNLIELFNAMLE
jgi:hypothetical protein